MLKTSKLTLLLLIFLSFDMSSNTLSLLCKGEATLADVGQLAGDVTVTSIESKKNYAEIILRFEDDLKKGLIQLPSIMRPNIGGKKIDTWELKDIISSDNEIKANFRINFANKPNISISRVTGRMEYKSRAFPKDFSGDCEVVNLEEKKF